VIDGLLYLLGVIFIVVGIAISIAVHELGHLIPAKKFGVRVKQYMVGFGPTVFSRHRGETEYGIKAIPLGGYITMIGMYPPEGKKVTGPFAKIITEARETAAEEITESDSGREFYRLTPCKKLVVMLGGPTMNLVLGVILVTVALSGIGTSQPVPKISAVSECVAPVGETCQSTDTPSPAMAAGLLSGDVILEIAGTEVDTWVQADALLRAQSSGQPVNILVQRAGENLNIQLTPVWVETDSGLAPRIGVFLASEQRALPLAESLNFSWQSTLAVFNLIATLPVAVWDVAYSLVTGGERDISGPISILGVGQIAGEVASADQVSLQARLGTGLLILGSLNFALFAFNLIPLLPLDGGHVVGALYESAKRKLYKLLGRPTPAPLDTARLVPMAYAVWLVLIVMGLVLILADLVNPVSL